MSHRITLNGHALSPEQVLMLGFAVGAAEYRLESGAITDAVLCTLMKQTLAELTAIVRGGADTPDAQDPQP